jgi:hypothetical protein
MKRFLVLLGIALFLTLTTLSFGTIASANSGRIYNPDNEHWYQRFDNPTMTWQDAKAFCESLGGYLATITSEAEDNFVYENLAADSPNVHPWLGGYQINKSDEPCGNWAWVTGETWSYNNFLAYCEWYGEPNNCAGIEDYLVYFTPWDADICPNCGDRSSFWNDLGEGADGGCGCGTCTDEWYHMSTICEWDSKIVVCHKPGTADETTLVVGSPALGAHLNHGDYLGACGP